MSAMYQHTRLMQVFIYMQQIVRLVVLTSRVRHRRSSGRRLRRKKVRDPCAELLEAGSAIVKKSAIFWRPEGCRTTNCPCLTRSRTQCKCMSNDLDIFWVTEELAMPTTAHSLSQYNGVGGWGCPKFSRIVLSSVAIRAAAKTPAYSVSTTKEHTTGLFVKWNRENGKSPLRTLPAFRRERRMDHIWVFKSSDRTDGPTRIRAAVLVACRSMVPRVGCACSAARAQVAVSIRQSTINAPAIVLQQPPCCMIYLFD